MKLKAGDRVKYLNSTGGGVIKKIIDSKLVEIEDENGFDVPVLISELIKVESDQMSIQPQAKQTNQPPAFEEPTYEPEIIAEEIDGNDSPKLYFAIVPKNDQLAKFDLYLINDCNYNFLFNYSHLISGKYTSIENSNLEANTKIFLGTQLKDELTNIKAFLFQGVFYKTKEFESLQPVFKEVSITPVKFFKPGSYTENDFFDEDALITTVHEQNQENIAEMLTADNINAIIKQQEQKRPRIPSKKENKDLKKQVKEVDLHIHELVETEAGLTPGDKLNIQVKEFEKELNAAIQDRLQKIVFIHGVGNGVLKTKIRSILDKDYKKLKYQDASFQKYKYGATLVFL